MQRFEDIRGRLGGPKRANPPEPGPRRRAEILTFADASSAYGAPRDVSEEENGRQPAARPTESEPKHLGFIWISCQSTTAVDLKRALEKEARVYHGQEPPEEGAPSSVVLCADGPEDLSESVEQIRKLYPDASILVFGPHTDLPLARATLRAGARGYVHARMKPDQLVRALRVVSKGELVATRKLLEYLVTETANGETADLDALSPRQRELLKLVADGLSNAQIARRLYLSESTVKQHLRASYKLLGIRNRAQAIRLFRHSARVAERPEP
jgi:DNA-binding NarL/FixJ family response regulator